MEKWQAIRAARAVVNAAIEPLRVNKSVGSSLQAEVRLSAPSDVFAALETLGDELRFVLLVSKVELVKGDELHAEVRTTQLPKCERCWHYTQTVGTVAGHETICARCADNIDGKGEERNYA